ncbi:MAG: hypothetical protein V3U52_09045, partial [Thermoplasmata archaeon]
HTEPEGNGRGRFNYHLKVLRKAGLIEVDQSTYRLTPRGSAVLTLLEEVMEEPISWQDGKERHDMGGLCRIRHFLPMVIALAVVAATVYAVFLALIPHDSPAYRLGGHTADRVTGELIDPATPDLRLAGLLLPSYMPHGLPLAGIVRADTSVYYLVFDRKPLESGEFDMLELVKAGAIILLETPTYVMTSEKREAWVAYVIEETDGKVERVSINGHVGSLGHGEIPQLRWWQGWRELNIIGHLTDEEFIAMAESVQPFA